MSIIEDGTGKGYTAKVDAENRLHTHSFTVCSDTSAALNDDAFDLCSGVMTLTSACESALLYVKNNEEDDLIISLQFLNIDTSTGGSGKSIVRYYLNPTGGTIISGASCASVSNRKIGSSETILADVYKGAEGSTITGGSTIEFYTNGFAANSPFILPKGKTFAVSVQPPSGNTSMGVSVGLYVIKNATDYGNDI